MKTDHLKIGMIQMKVLFSKPEENLENAKRLVKEAKEEGANICVLPECLDVGWGNTEAAALACPIPGTISNALCRIAEENEIFLVAGLTERAGERLYNTALLISDEGKILFRHRKINILTGVEDLYSVGDHIGVTETKFGKIAIDICADNSSNSLSVGTTLGRMGAALLLSPCAWAVRPDRNVETEPYGEEWHVPYKKLSSAFSMPVIGVSNVGTVDQGSWKGWKAIGNSVAYDSDGSLITVLPYGEEKECVQVIEIHLKEQKLSGTALSEKLQELCF